MEDDQAIVIHVRDKGLVVLPGCAHAGIINTIRYAREINGASQVYAIHGGFHLARSNPEEIQATIAAVQALDPELVVSCHCIGFDAICAFSKLMPEQFIPGVVGATYHFNGVYFG